MDVEKIGSEFLVNTEAAAYQEQPTVTGLAGGGFVVTWYTGDTTQDGSGSAIKAQVFDAEGTPQGAEFLVNTEVTSSQGDPEVTGLANGGFVVTWYTADTAQDGSGSAIKAQVFDAEGTPLGAEFLVNTEATGTQSVPAVTGLADGDFVVAWQTSDSAQDGNGTAIKAQVFGADGTPQGAEFLVNTEATSGQFDPTVTGLADGGFVVAWQTADLAQDGSSTAIKAQVFDADGTPQGGEFLVNTEATSGQSDPTVTDLADGGFVVAWTTDDDTQDGDAYAIKAQAFDADGTPRGAEFLVNTEATDYQYEPTVTGLADGDFVVAWQTSDSAQDGSSTAIKAQIFSAGSAPTPTGTDGPDTLIGTDGEDLLTGLADDDVLKGRGNNDTLRGQDGDDSLNGGAGDDELRGGADNDVLTGNSGNDSLYGGSGDDLLKGGGGDDLLRGNSGKDRLQGGAGNDGLFGGAGEDVLKGNSGNDTLHGQGGDDRLGGGDGRDVLAGGQGNDILTGGKGADVFVFNWAAGTDTITDFDAGRDVIEITSGAGSLGDLEITQSGDDAILRFADTEIVVRDITVSDLQDADLYLFS